MKVVYKYSLDGWEFPHTQHLFDIRLVEMLDLQIQGKTPVFWAVVESSWQPRKVRVNLVPTGGILIDRVPSRQETYLGTLQFEDWIEGESPLVLHAFWSYEDAS